MIDYKFSLSKIIDREDFTGATIYGKQRLGKTSYAYQVMFDLYKDWDVVFQKTFFKIDELITHLEFLVDNQQKDKCLLWDDASVHGSSQLYWSDRDLANYLSALTDVIGTSTQALLLTTPNPYRLLKAVRDYEWFLVKVSKHDANARRAKGYLTNMLPSGTKRVRTTFEDEFNKLLPDNVYKKYNDIRLTYNKDVLHTRSSDP